MICFPLFTDDGKIGIFLQFMTGLQEVPPLGFDPPLGISFNHEEDELKKGMPYADTCANTFTIPVGLIYEKFKEIMYTVLFEVGCLFSNQ